MVMNNVVEYNTKLREEYEKTHSLDVLERYVLSETLAPIEDHENAVRLIRESYEHAVSCNLLIIGAFLCSKWCFGDTDNDLLHILNEMYPQLSPQKKGIVSFLNAHEIYFRDQSHYRTDPQYERLLRQSIDENPDCVRSRAYLAELYSERSRATARAFYEDAAAHILEVLSAAKLEKMRIEDFLQPEAFIQEHILGTRISYVNYEFYLDCIQKLK